jgi:GDPmannose 4,6-dehydratase
MTDKLRDAANEHPGLQSRRALVTGITGQDGAYMADLLLSKGYDVYGGFRRSSTPNFWRLRALGIFEKVRLISFDLGDQGSIEALFAVARPDECYNFASQSSVPVSFQQPDYTNDVNAGGVIRMLHAMRRLATSCTSTAGLPSTTRVRCGALSS